MQCFFAGAFVETNAQEHVHEIQPEFETFPGYMSEPIVLFKICYGCLGADLPDVIKQKITALKEKEKQHGT